jgi:hypothetical protein
VLTRPDRRPNVERVIGRPCGGVKRATAKFVRLQAKG